MRNSGRQTERKVFIEQKHELHGVMLREGMVQSRPASHFTWAQLGMKTSRL